MNSKLDAAQDLKKLALQFRGLFAVADELERLGSLEAAIARAESDAQTKYLELHGLDKEVAAQQKAIEDAKALALANRQEVEQFSKSAIQQAVDQAKAIVDDAVAKAEQLKTASAQQKQAADEALHAAEAELKQIRAAIDERQKQHADWIDKLAALQRRIAGIA
jgi:chromosome segregation ATPase